MSSRALDKDIQCIPPTWNWRPTFESMGMTRPRRRGEFSAPGIEADPKNLPIKAALANFLTEARKTRCRRNPWRGGDAPADVREETASSDVACSMGAARAGRGGTVMTGRGI